MKPFVLNNPKTIDEAAATLSKGNAAILAGGTDLLTVLKSMLSPSTAPATLVNIKGIAGLDYIKEEGGMLKVGAATRLITIARSALVQGKYTALAEAAARTASPQLRNMGTIAGNICQQVRCWYYRGDGNIYPCLRKDPKGLCYAVAGDNRYHSIFGAVSGCVAVSPSDIAPALVAFEAKIKTNKKTWDIKDFFAVNGQNTTALAADEIITEIQISTPAAGTKSSYQKFAFRKSFDFPIVGCAAVVTLASGTVSASRIVLGAVHNLPRLATGAADAIKGKSIDDTSAGAAGDAAVNGAAPLSGNKYMVQIARTMVKRAVLACK